MKARPLHWIACILLTSSLVSAQDTTLFFADFEGGLPPGWLVGGSPTVTWRVMQNGECGSVTRMLACNSASPACNYSTGAPIPGYFVALPPIGPLAPQPAWQFSFDYILDIDAVGDGMAVAFFDQDGSTIAFVTSGFVNDGALHSIVLPVPLDPSVTALTVHFAFGTDGVGDLRRGWFVDNVRFSSTAPGAIFCDGSSPALCPCNNAGIFGTGCANSLGAGALLRGTGNPSVSHDSLLLGVEAVPPNAPTLFFGGSAQAGAVFGDGRRCVGGTITRLRTKTSAAGNAAYPEPGDARISTLEPVAAGTTRYYQAFYRNLGGPCGSGFNLTNGWSTTWGP